MCDNIAVILSSSTKGVSGADPGFGNGGARFVAKRVTYIRVKRVTSEASYEGSEYKSAGGTGGRCKPPGKFLNLEPLRVNLSVI